MNMTVLDLPMLVAFLNFTVVQKQSILTNNAGTVVLSPGEFKKNSTGEDGYRKALQKLISL